MGRKKVHTINMMLHRKYVDNWGVKEALRELYANCIDADSDCLIDFPHRGQVELKTSSTPSLTEMILMGAGSKDASGATIGQFGEGAKLAALVLTRGRHRLEILCPAGKITFKFQKAPLLDEPTLHAVVDPNETIEGFYCTFHAAKVEEIFERHFLSFNTLEGPLKKQKHAKGMRVYHRGIHVTTMKDESLYDWNLKNIKLNRDRTIPESWDLRYRIASMIDSALQRGDSQLADSLLCNPNSFEVRALAACYMSESSKQMLAARFQNKYGDQAVLSSGNAGRHNALAAAKGHSVIPLPSDLANSIHEGGVDRASDVLLKSDSMTAMDPAPFQEELEEVRQLLDIIGVGPVAIMVFEEDGKHAGAFDKHGVWLSEKLFAPGNRFERIRTLLHEVGHQKGGGDVTVQFENSLDFVAAKLGQFILDHK